MRRRSERPAVVLPQPLSPTSPRVSPGATAKEMSSTARTWATTREKTPFFTGKYFFRARTSIKGGIRSSHVDQANPGYRIPDTGKNRHPPPPPPSEGGALGAFPRGRRDGDPSSRDPGFGIRYSSSHHVAGHPVARTELPELRFDALALLDGDRAAGMELAARGEAERVGHRALDHVEALALLRGQRGPRL